MTETTSDAKVSRTQAERTAAMRGRLLDAAVESLVELGYARTSTQEIARRAGVSRGTQLHHFPTKESLVVAAVEYLVDKR
ncbi:TetR/AcrR family transcriptional regulator, partial [Rhodococcus erythropolis]